MNEDKNIEEIKKHNELLFNNKLLINNIEKKYPNKYKRHIIRKRNIINIEENITDIEGNIPIFNEENTLEQNEENIKALPNRNEDNIIITKTNNKKTKSRRVIYILPILTFIFVLILVIKTFYYGNKIDKYEEVFIRIKEKEETDMKVYLDKDIDNKTIKKIAASNLITCINSKVDINNLPNNIKNIINEINSYYNQSNNYFAYSYKDIYTGFTISYNANQSIFSASSIKAPKDIYLYEMASAGKVNLNEKLTYTPNYYNTGSGLLKNKPTNTKYTVKTLLEYSTVHSDNAAHNMLMDRYGRVNMLKFWKEKGTKHIFTKNTNWGITSAHDATIYMEELYKFYSQDNEYSNALMNNFISSYPKFIKGKNNYQVASKSGWSGTVLHEMTIVFAENPYIVIALSNLGDKDYYQSYFNKVNDLTYKLHTEYWKYKIDSCKIIKQYQ